MASIKVKFRPSAIVGHEGTIYYQVTHGRRTRQLSSPYKILPEEWSGTAIIINQRSERCGFLKMARQEILRDMERMKMIIKHLEDQEFNLSVDEIIERFEEYKRENNLFIYMKSIIKRLKKNGQTRTSETYTVTLNIFRKFRDDEDLMLDCMTSDTMEAFEFWLKERGLSLNTISFYMRILRAVYNRAVEEGRTENRYPFRHVYTGIAKTVKRALPIAILKRIRKLDLRWNPTLDYARDMFLMSFMLRGMSFIDMAYLRKSDLANGYITYKRRKTGQRLIIQWTGEMQRLLDKYPRNESHYLLPIIKTQGRNERYTYRNVGYNINHSLKTIGEQVGLTIPLTLYVARHSWASAAKAKGIPLSVISEGMGHESETTTQIYLASLDTSAIDQANSLILSCIN